MESGVLTSLSLVFLVAGLTLWITSLALSRRSRRYRHGMHALLQLAGQAHDPLDLPAAAWPILQRAGWQSIRWTGDWYGQPVAGHIGTDPESDLDGAALQEFDIRSGQDVRLSLQMLHSSSRGEQRLLAAQLAQVFLLLIETRLRERTGALSAALAEQARLTLYLQHDMRNLAQWVMWVSADFSNAQSEKDLLVLGERLQSNAPLAQERAQRLMNALGKSRHSLPPRSIALREAVGQAAQLAGIELDIVGDAQVWIAPDVLARVLDNLLSNLAGDWRQGHSARPKAHLGSAEQTGPPMPQLALVCPLPPHGLGLSPERLFEPFASGRPGGLGLGLFQARKSLRDVGGDLKASLDLGHVRFDLSLPTPQDQASV